jgi:hypothetical protein
MASRSALVMGRQRRASAREVATPTDTDKPLHAEALGGAGDSEEPAVPARTASPEVTRAEEAAFAPEPAIAEEAELAAEIEGPAAPRALQKIAGFRGAIATLGKTPMRAKRALVMGRVHYLRVQMNERP